jgi:glycosyltransferase involved in cell wall biosynthesis
MGFDDTVQNILVVTNHFYPGGWGGSSRVVYELFRRIASPQNRVTVVTRRVDERYAQTEYLAGMRVLRFEVSGSRWLFRYFFVVLNTFRYVRKLDAVNKFDLVNYHDPFTALGVNLALRGRRVRIATSHSPFFKDALESHRSETIKNPLLKALHRRAVLFYAALIKCIEKHGYQKADKVICLSRFSRAELMREYDIPAERIVIIPGGIDTDKFSPKKAKMRLRQKLNLPGEKLILFTARRLERQKGIDLLLHALKEMVREVPDLLLVIAGEGSKAEELKQLSRELGVSEFVRFEGLILEGIEEYYRAADLFILPTKAHEPFGLATLEALASSTLVLGTPYGATRDILREIDERLLFKAEANSAQMAGQMLDILKLIKAGKLTGLARRCREYVVKNYSWEKAARQTLELFSHYNATRCFRS